MLPWSRRLPRLSILTFTYFFTFCGALSVQVSTFASLTAAIDGGTYDAIDVIGDVAFSSTITISGRNIAISSSTGAQLSGSGSRRLFQILSGSMVNFTGLTMTEGYVSYSANTGGGCMYVSYSTLHLADVAFSSSTVPSSSLAGGCIRADYSVLTGRHSLIFRLFCG